MLLRALPRDVRTNGDDTEWSRALDIVMDSAEDLVGILARQTQPGEGDPWAGAQRHLPARPERHRKPYALTSVD